MGERIEIEGMSSNLILLYLNGDLNRAEYLRQRAEDETND